MRPTYLRKTLLYAFGFILGVALAAVTPKVNASDVDQATFLTFHRPVRIPGGQVLPAGTYLFKTLDEGMNSGTNGVRISNPDGTRIYATLLTSPVLRSDTSANPQLNFAERSRQPATLLAWFYPDSFYGHQFIYSDEEAGKIKEENHVTVMAAPDSSWVTSRIVRHADN